MKGEGKMKQYRTPEFDLQLFHKEDVIVASVGVFEPIENETASDNEQKYSFGSLFGDITLPGN